MDFSGMTLEQIDQIAKRVNFPTFEEFCKGREKYVPPSDALFQAVDRGSHELRHVQDAQEYEFRGFRFKTLERVAEAIENEGLKLTEIEMRPRVEQSSSGNGRYKIVVAFLRKGESSEKGGVSL